ncbi:MAG: M10 family metallopeptidase C-terminal domain-containing protein, partial [Alphaproteobacteria bacterium]|nr:M10 family metallopeptidase C-terminal domain-containing protein [Alphaproteobacteria bacterium]
MNNYYNDLFYAAWAADGNGDYVINFTYSDDYDYSTPFPRIDNDVNGISSGTASEWNQAIQVWQSIADITFSHTSLPWQADLALLDSSSLNLASAPGVAYRDEDSNVMQEAVSFVNTGANFRTYLHELGHVLGLDHPGGGEGDDPAYAHYNREMSIMRYANGQPNGAVEGVNFITPMIFDIAAIQKMYGHNDEYKDGDDTYTLNAVTSPGEAFTIWDAGGTDTIDASNISSAYASDGFNKIDLRGGVDENGKPIFSYVSGNIFSIALDPDQNWEKAIIIENAIGSQYKDMLIGNSAPNVLVGGQAADTLIGGEWDLLVGGDGDDIIIEDEGIAWREYGI